jgi:hypothetical protein
MKNTLFLDVTPCGSCKNRSWEERMPSMIRMIRIGELRTTSAVGRIGSTLHASQRASVASSPILVILIMDAICSSETSVLTRATRRNIPAGGILHSHRREILKSYGT